MQLVFATNNKNKFLEVKSLLKNDFELLRLGDIACKEELPETHETIEENSEEKARYVYDNYKVNCFAEDTGLLIDALNEEPGVYSARYAGENCSSKDNIELVLEKLEGEDNRSAYFKTIITLVIAGNIKQFEGIVKGTIERHCLGEDGFGYDPIFKPDGCSSTFAEMSLTEKNIISHRGLATKKLLAYLNALQ